MRLRVTHETAYRYEEPATRAIQILRLTPRGFDTQFVIGSRIEVDVDCRLDNSVDPFGNKVSTFTVEGPLEALTITAFSEFETQDSHGVVQGQPERMPPDVYLRDTDLTLTDRAIRTVGEEAAAEAKGDAIDTCHGIMRRLREHMRFEVNLTDTGTTARDAFAMGHGVCQDFSHIFIGAARHIGIPARYVSGYLFDPDKPDAQEAGHAWAEALIPNLGWVSFDPANGVSATDRYLRVAVGLDYLGAAPVRGTRYGGAGESLSVRILVHEAGRKPM